MLGDQNRSQRDLTQSSSPPRQDVADSSASDGGERLGAYGPAPAPRRRRAGQSRGPNATEQSIEQRRSTGATSPSLPEVPPEAPPRGASVSLAAPQRGLAEGCTLSIRHKARRHPPSTTFRRMLSTVEVASATSG